MFTNDYPIHINNQRLKRAVERIMIKIGLAPHYQGFNYIRDCVLYNIAKNDEIKYIELYSIVAAFNKVTITSISKAIRAICQYCQNKLFINIPKLFGFTPENLINKSVDRVMPVENSFILFSISIYILMIYKNESEIFPVLPDYRELAKYSDNFKKYLLSIKNVIFNENCRLVPSSHRTNAYPITLKDDFRKVNATNYTDVISINDYKSDISILNYLSEDKNLIKGLYNSILFQQ